MKNLLQKLNGKMKFAETLFRLGLVFVFVASCAIFASAQNRLYIPLRPIVINRAPVVINRPPIVINRVPVLINRPFTHPVLINRAPIVINRAPVVIYRRPVVIYRAVTLPVVSRYIVITKSKH